MRRPNILDFPIIFLILLLSSAFVLLGDFINYQRKSIPAQDGFHYRNEEIRSNDIIDIKTKIQPEDSIIQEKIGKFKYQQRKVIK